MRSPSSPPFFRRALQTIEHSPKYVEKRFDMNHPIDLDPESNRRANPQAHPRVDPELCASTSFILNEGEGLSTLPRTECARHEVSLSKGRRVDLYPESNRRADPETNTDLKTQNSGAFNQARSKQGRLTYSRLGGILSAVGFTRAKTPNGCSAIIWDDQLLSQDTDSNIHNSLPDNCLEVK